MRVPRRSGCSLYRESGGSSTNGSRLASVAWEAGACEDSWLRGPTLSCKQGAQRGEGAAPPRHQRLSGLFTPLSGPLSHAASPSFRKHLVPRAGILLTLFQSNPALPGLLTAYLHTKGLPLGRLRIVCGCHSCIRCGERILILSGGTQRGEMFCKVPEHKAQHRSTASPR